MRIPLTIAAALLTSARPSAAIDAPEEASLAPATPEHEVRLSESDLQLITMEVLKEHPLLSSSPGIKWSYGSHGFSSMDDAKAAAPSMVMASVIFYPHAETGGIKQAYEADCHRSVSSKAWSCQSIEIRRYVKLDSQDFEVRVTGNIDLQGVQAVIDATRQLAATVVADGSDAADTVLVIHPANEGYFISWGTKEGYGKVGLEAQLRNAGDPGNPNDWNARVLFPES